MKKGLILLVLLIGGFLYFKWPVATLGQYCAFCDQAVLDNQVFYEDELVLALYTHKPIYPGHCLIVSKRHVERFELLSDEEITQMGRVIKKVHGAVSKVFGISSYLLLEKNGVEVGQTVPHVHFHYIPRKTGDDSTISFMVRMLIANVKPPISKEEMDQAVTQLKEAISN